MTDSVKCETCRDLTDEYLTKKRVAEVFKDTDRTFSWTVRIGDETIAHEYRFKDARGDCSVRDIAMLIKLFLDSDSYEHKLIKP